MLISISVMKQGSSVVSQDDLKKKIFEKLRNTNIKLFEMLKATKEYDNPVLRHWIDQYHKDLVSEFEEVFKKDEDH